MKNQKKMSFSLIQYKKNLNMSVTTFIILFYFVLKSRKNLTPKKTIKTNQENVATKQPLSTFNTKGSKSHFLIKHVQYFLLLNIHLVAPVKISQYNAT